MTAPMVEARAQAQRVAELVRAAPPEAKFRVFYDALRASELPFLPALRSDPRTLFSESFEALYVLGAASLPLAVGFTMHQYMFSALASAPGDDRDPEFLGRRRALVADMLARRRLIAVSNVGANASLPGVDFAIEERDGAFLLHGKKSFQSIAGEAELMTVCGEVSDRGFGAFVVELKDRPEVKIGAPVFPGPMALADTRGVSFAGYAVRPEHVLSLEEDASYAFLQYATGWFNALIGAAYLGAAASALEELRLFTRSSRAPDGDLIAELDGVIVEAGRLGILLKSSLAIAASFTNLLGADVESLYDGAAVIKHHSTHAAETIVHTVRRLIGTRALKQGEKLAELSAQIIFGPLHPVIDAELERTIGAQVLGEDPIL